MYYQGRALPGFTTVILLQLIIGGFLMVSLGIIGTYIARIYDEVKARPRYVVQEVAAVTDTRPGLRHDDGHGAARAMRSPSRATTRRGRSNRHVRRSASGMRPSCA